MDPFSLVAGSLSILQAIGQILNICYNTRAILKNKPWCLSRLQDEVKELRDVLEAIFQLSLDSRDSETDGKENNALRLLEQSQSGRGPLILCLEALRELEELLLKKYSKEPRTKVHAVMRAITWDLSESEVQPILERLERSKSALKLAIAADEVALLIELNKWSTTMSNDITQVNHTLKDLTMELATRNISEKTQQILKWLSPVDPWDSYASSIKRCHDGTGQWFLQSMTFESWKDKGSPNIWLSGFTGSGKTILLSNAIREVTLWTQQNSTRPRVAYFYCDFRNSEAQTLANILGSIIRQILLQSDDIPGMIESHFRLCTAGGNYRKPEVPFLMEALSIMTYQSRLLVIIDALDEIEDRAEILDFFWRASSEFENISFLISSRENEDIGQSLDHFRHIRIENQIAKLDEDITRYIDHRLQVDPSFQWLSSRVKDDIARSLHSQAAGMFRWVQCQMETLTKLRTVAAIRQSLEQLPHDLHETYERVLARVSKIDQEPVRRILTWVTFTVSPLTLEELHIAIAIEPGADYLDEESLLRSPQDILALVGGLLSVTEKGHVTLAHMSVKTYLFSEEVRHSKTTDMYAMSEGSAKEELFRKCMTYLSYQDLRKGPCKSAPEYLDRLRKYPFLKHAARFWPYYYRASRPSTELEMEVVKFMAEDSRSLFMSWVQIINADTPFSWDFYPRHATSLYYAATFGLTRIVERLVGLGVDLDAPGSRYGGTALHGAVYRMHTPVVKLLLDAGADINKADFLKVTPLHTAATLGDVELLKLLLDFSAKTDATDGMGESPIDWARKSGQFQMQDLLLGHEIKDDKDPQVAIAIDANPDGVWEASSATIPYFPDFHGHRSGMRSSIIVQVEIGDKVLTEEGHCATPSSSSAESTV
ncbi:hypothetical protein F5Y07DRAFT_367646 [Xylaria sp. FL0933]|nr:hypothetical protein F5Y07DRAFT_367646 [Xylaria sp. FL0933]